MKTIYKLSITYNHLFPHELKLKEAFWSFFKYLCLYTVSYLDWKKIDKIGSLFALLMRGNFFHFASNSLRYFETLTFKIFRPTNLKQKKSFSWLSFCWILFFFLSSFSSSDSTYFGCETSVLLGKTYNNHYAKRDSCSQ